MRTKRNLLIGSAVVLFIAVLAVWMRWGPDSWDVQITGVTGDGGNTPYRIETVYAGTTKSLIFKNKDAGLGPPYLKFDSADLQALASRITRDCPKEPVTVHGYGLRVPLLNMFPNATAIDAPRHCKDAASAESDVAANQQ